MPLDIVNYMDFLKTKYKKKEYGAIVPRKYLLEPYNKFLKVIQRYISCERIFRRVYQYHCRLLMHFTRKIPLSMPLTCSEALVKWNIRFKVRKVK